MLFFFKTSCSDARERLFGDVDKTIELYQFASTTSPKGFSASKCDVGNWKFFKKIRIFKGKCVETFCKIGGDFLAIVSGGILSGGILLEGIFLEEFFGGIFWKEMSYRLPYSGKLSISKFVSSLRC